MKRRGDEEGSNRATHKIVESYRVPREAGHFGALWVALWAEHLACHQLEGDAGEQQRQRQRDGQPVAARRKLAGEGEGRDQRDGPDDRGHVDHTELGAAHKLGSFTYA